MTPTTILLVEDDENDVFFFQRAVNKTRMTHPLQVAHDGQEAIDYLSGAGRFAERAKFPLPGLILLDLKLPFVMGLDVLKWIRDQSELTPIVIILSSSSAEEDVARAYQLGANAYLVKSADVSKLEHMVRAINDFWLTQNVPPAGTVVERGSQTLSNPRAQGCYSHGHASVNNSFAHSASTLSRTDL
jgi:two-component system response regulator